MIDSQAKASKRKMDNFGQSIVLFLCTAVATVSIATAQSCNDCDCQLINVGTLRQPIEDQVKLILKEKPRKF